MSFLAGMGFSTMSCPPTVTLPAVGGMNPVIMRMVVDFPAPFGPRKPSTSPRSTVNEMPSTARFGPNAFTSLSIFIMLKEGRNYRRITRLQSADVWRLGHKRHEIRSRFTRVDRGGDARYIAGSDRSAIPDQTRKDYRALRPRRRQRFHRTFRGPAADRSSSQAGHRRKQARGWRRARHRAGHQGGARRLYAHADRLELHGEPERLQAQLRPGQRHHADHSDVAGTAPDRGAAVAAREEHQGADRPRQVEARPRELRLLRPGERDPSRHRAFC